MKNIFAAFVFIALLAQSVSATTYFFTGNEDSYYENPANWTPSFPGYVISKNDCIVVNANMSFEGYNITLEGKMIVELGATITSPSNGFIIKGTGRLNNNGEMALGMIVNNGEISNSTSAIIFADTYISQNQVPVTNLVYVNSMANKDDVQGIADGGVHRMQDMNYRSQSVTRGSKKQEATTTTSTTSTTKNQSDADKYAQTNKDKK